MYKKHFIQSNSLLSYSAVYRVGQLLLCEDHEKNKLWRKKKKRKIQGVLHAQIILKMFSFVSILPSTCIIIILLFHNIEICIMDINSISCIIVFWPIMMCFKAHSNPGISIFSCDYHHNIFAKRSIYWNTTNQGNNACN